ncbi:hypothetical protein FD755_020817, partial [Muntiacus reevesi]
GAQRWRPRPTDRGIAAQGPGCLLSSPPGAADEGCHEGPVRRQGKVTVKAAHSPLRLPGEEILELEIDVDELDTEGDDTQAARIKEQLVDCYKPTEAFICGLLDKIQGMQKLSTPQKK